MLEQLKKLVDVKSLVTLAMTGVMIALLLGDANPSKEVLALFCTSYGSIITYFFTKKSTTGSEEIQDASDGKAD